MNLEDRFWNKVSGGDFMSCWVWTRSKTPGGYGRFTVRAGKWVSAHRWAYESMRTEIPSGLILDHLCRNRACVNPWHLEPVNHRQNALRGRLWESEKTHCIHGHRYSDANTYRTPEGHRECRTCRLATSRKHAPAKREYLRRYRAAHKLADAETSA